MKLKLVSIGMIPALLLFVLFSANAQFNVPKTGQLTDQQLMQFLQKNQQAGLSTAEMMKMLGQKDMSISDINAFKKRVLDLQLANPNSFAKKTAVKDTMKNLRDTSWIFELPEEKKNIPYYGFDFFNNSTINFTPNFQQITPVNYLLGANDQLLLTITGMNEWNTSSYITREGKFEIPHAGFVHLQGLTLEQAKTTIKNNLLKVYPALASGKTQLHLTLGNVRSIKITIIGEAALPGDYTVSSLANFFHVLYLSGGPAANGSLRKIELIRGNKVIEVIDFYQFLQKGILEKLLRLEDQDIIRYPLYQKRVSLAGEVKRPAIYELLEKETLSDLLKYAGGFNSNAYQNLAKIEQVGATERQLKDLMAHDFSHYIPHNADSIVFTKISDRFTNRVNIQGAVERPGNYELSDGMSLLKLIQKTNGVREDAFIDRAYIKRFLPGNAERTIVSFNLKDILLGKANDLLLMREDSVFINAKEDLMDVQYFTISGNVHRPGSYPFRKGITLEDAILMAGGFTSDAANQKVEISRLEKNKADTLSNQVLNLIKASVDPTLSNHNTNIQIAALDYIFVPKLLNYQTLGSVKLAGEVLYSGNYALERRDETVQDVIKRAGGLSPYASITNVQVFRNNIRVATNLFSSGAEKTDKFLLLPNDSIYIPRKSPFVEIVGAVYNPQIISYQTSRFTSYLSAAGGVTENGNLRKAYIQYPNGLNKKIRQFLGIKTYPKVIAGSKIIVPERNQNEKRGLSILEISTLTGTFATLISLIAVLRK